MTAQDWIALASGIGGAILGGAATLWGSKISFDSQRNHELEREREEVRHRFSTHVRVVCSAVDNFTRHEHVLRLRELMFERPELCSSEVNRQLLSLLVIVPADNKNQTDALIERMKALARDATLPD